MNLYDKLVRYGGSGCYPMHMPGHKRNTDMMHMLNPYTLDITEIEGFDNLHHAEGILKEGMSRAAALYGSEHTDYLVGGSTAGILAGIAACTRKGDRILAARNCHKSVYHAIELNELLPVYLYPQQEDAFGINGGISPEKTEEMLIRHPDIKLVVITSPTYEGILSDIKKISETVHRFGIPLLVDEAHGAHLGFHSSWPENSVRLGADIVIHSIHKTLPALTQTGLIHVNGKLVDYDEVLRYLGMYQSSSPSYVLMAGIEQCIGLLEQKREELFKEYEERLKLFRDRMGQLEKLRLLTREEVRAAGGFDYDPSKIVISAKGVGLTGNRLYYGLLDDYKIQMEMAAKDYVLGITSICDTDEGFVRLAEALLGIDSRAGLNSTDSGADNDGSTGGLVIKDKEGAGTYPDIAMPSHKAYEAPKESVPLKGSAGRTAAEYVYLYPPGIPLLVPGERISEKLIREIAVYRENGLSVQGMRDAGNRYIKVVAEDVMWEPAGKERVECQKYL